MSKNLSMYLKQQFDDHSSQNGTFSATVHNLEEANKHSCSKAVAIVLHVSKHFVRVLA